MNLKKKMKGFFTLTRKADGGFTLVELIVVIAILAILAGIGVPAYSGYITKTNMQADMTLVSDIEYALTLAGFEGTFAEGESGYLVLTTEGIKMSDESGSPVEMVEGSNMEKALIDTFGSSYENVLKLKYAEWGNNNLYLSLTDPGAAQAIVDSTYFGVSDQLMGQVKEITDAALHILEINSSGNNRNDMIALFAAEGEAAGESAFLSGIAQMYGYVDADGNGDLSKVKDEELPNLLVMAVAMDVSTGAPANEVSGLIQDFALFNAYAATEQGQAEGFDDAYNDFIATANGASSVNAVADAYLALRDKTKAANSGFNTYKSGQGSTDVAAFDTMMYGLASATIESNAALTKANLADANFFTTGVGNQLFSSYMKAVEAFAGLEFADENAANAFYEAIGAEGAVGVFFTSFGTYASVSNSLPVG